MLVTAAIVCQYQDGPFFNGLARLLVQHPLAGADVAFNWLSWEGRGRMTAANSAGFRAASLG